MSEDRYPQTISDGSQAAVARYVADLSAELAVLARAQRLDLLAYFLDMAVLEARNRTKGPAAEDAA